MPKATRAELHERFAAWLDEHRGALVELDELLGHHLEQAARFNESWDDRVALAERAAARLGVAGLRALDRGDMVGAINLLERDGAAATADDARIELELDLGEALQEAGRLTEAEALLEQTALEQLAATIAHPRRGHSSASCPCASRRGRKEHPIIRATWSLWCAAFEEAGDHRDAANALRLLGVIAGAGPRRPTCKNAPSRMPCGRR